MKKYQPLPLRYRPQTFSEVVGQEAIVQTLRNAIQHQRLATAYLFTGSRGTGKTTLARLLAKAINCENPLPDPCNQCLSCLEISKNKSLDLIEIDSASHRGIDDIRALNENASYVPSQGKYKVFILDEVHMLTKEAFNALLKTLEEPPPTVKFCFATTEPHKVLPTILSRCQRFDLKKISPELIVQKCAEIISKEGISCENSALSAIAEIADGSLRDAELLLDQVICYSAQNPITEEMTYKALRRPSRQLFFSIDKSLLNSDAKSAFSLSQDIINQGIDSFLFLERLLDHFRTHLAFLLGARHYLSYLSEHEKKHYSETSSFYSETECLEIMQDLIEATKDPIKFSSEKLYLETILLKIITIKKRISLSKLVERLTALENNQVSCEAMTSLKEKQPSQKEQEPLKKEKAACHTETLLRFASIELDGTLRKE